MGSGYGNSFRGEKIESASFRDSYQTSAFHAMLLALQHAGAGDLLLGASTPWKPTVFEIGSRGASECIVPRDQPRPNEPRELRSIFTLLFPILLAFTLIALVTREMVKEYLSRSRTCYDTTLEDLEQPGRREGMRKRVLAAIHVQEEELYATLSTRTSVWFTLCAPVVLILLIAASQVSNEPLEMVNCTGVWPKIMAYALVVMLCLACLLRVVQRLKASQCDIEHARFFAGDTKVDQRLETEKRYHEERKTQYEKWTKHFWTTLYGELDGELRGTPWDRPWLPFVASRLAWTGYDLIHRNRKASDTKDKHNKRNIGKEYWEEYQKMSTPVSHALRAFPWAAAMSGALIFYLCTFDMDSLAVRDSVDRGVFAITHAMAAFLTFFLLFWLFDMVRLCRHFITLIAKSEFNWLTPEDALSATSSPRLREKEIMESGNEEYVAMEMIGCRTTALQHCLYYPAFAILLLCLTRNTLGEPLGWNQTFLLFLYLLPIALAIYSVVDLKFSAEAARREMLNSLRDKQCHVLHRYSAESKVDEQAVVDNLEKAYKRMAEDPFGGWALSPVIGPLLVPAGGMSALWLLQWISAFLQ